MAFQRLAKELEKYLPHHDFQNPGEADRALRRYYDHGATLPQRHQTKILQILTSMSVLDMGKKKHRGDQKVNDRSHGQAMRKKRTGNRRG